MVKTSPLTRHFQHNQLTKGISLEMSRDWFLPQRRIMEEWGRQEVEKKTYTLAEP